MVGVGGGESAWLSKHTAYPNVTMAAFVRLSESFWSDSVIHFVESILMLWRLITWGLDRDGVNESFAASTTFQWGQDYDFGLHCEIGLYPSHHCLVSLTFWCEKRFQVENLSLGYGKLLKLPGRGQGWEAQYTYFDTKFLNIW